MDANKDALRRSVAGARRRAGRNRDLSLGHPLPRPRRSAESPGQPHHRRRTPSIYGPGSCSSTTCHGSIAPRTDNRVKQNEYSVWIVRDKHSKAYQALTGMVGERMAAILNIGKAEEAPKCLACHALDVPAAERARTFDLSEGVSCESCHGPASAWLGHHTERDWTHAQSVQAGMTDLRDVGSAHRQMPLVPSRQQREIRRSRNDRRRPSRPLLRARFLLRIDAAPLERAGRTGRSRR